MRSAMSEEFCQVLPLEKNELLPHYESYGKILLKFVFNSFIQETSGAAWCIMDESYSFSWFLHCFSISVYETGN